MRIDRHEIAGQLLDRLRRPSLLWGYIAIAAIGVFSTLGVEAYWLLFELRPSGGRYPFVIFAIGVMFVILLARPFLLVIRLHPQPLKQIREDIIAYRGWLATSALIALALPQALQFSSVMKKTIPEIVPFYADSTIARIEHSLLGADAWQFTHMFIGESLSRNLDVVYGLWHLVNISLLVWLVLTMNRHFQVRAVLTYQLTWILLGGVLATALASVGPCFLEVFTGDNRFEPLMERLRDWNEAERLHSITAMGYLLRSEGTDAFGAGISAMPSLHVAIAYLLVLMVFDRLRSQIIRFASIVYFVVILVGSVHLGWHYLLDGVVAVPLAWLVWWSIGKWVSYLDDERTKDFGPVDSD